VKKLFIDSAINSDDRKISIEISIEGNDRHHLAEVLRVAINDTFIIGDPNGNEFISTIVQIDKKRIVFRTSGLYERKKYPHPEVRLFFCVLKSDRNEIIVQKCTELGVDKMIPVLSRNCVVRPDENSCLKKLEKWKNIAKEASMQCGRLRIPEIFPIVRFENINKYDIDSLKIFGFIDENSLPLVSILKNNEKPGNIDLFVGPEGDFTEEETSELKNGGWLGANFGQNVLRSETAAMFLASSVLFFYQEGNK
jgi:16S rRNA (uracil1498-N3)-methyltransferase